MAQFLQAPTSTLIELAGSSFLTIQSYTDKSVGNATAEGTVKTTGRGRRHLEARTERQCLSREGSGTHKARAVSYLCCLTIAAVAGTPSYRPAALTAAHLTASRVVESSYMTFERQSSKVSEQARKSSEQAVESQGTCSVSPSP